MRIDAIDKWCERFLLALGIAKLVLLLAFFVSFSGVSSSLAANDTPFPACSGNNLVAMLEKDDPAKLAAIRAAAAAVANADSILWKIEKDGQDPSWLFGTMHMADPAITALPEKVEKALARANAIVIESVESLDPAAARRAMVQLAHLTLLEAPQTLSSLINPDLADELEAALAERNIPFVTAQRMRPWLIATAVALPVCELARKQANVKVLDHVIAAHAQENGKALIGLETIEEQFTAIASLPRTFHLAALEETLALGKGAEDLIETMKALYLNENIGMILPLMQAVAPKSNTGKDAAGFQKILIEKRNIVMATRMLPMLEKGGAFVAIGALHLPAQTGLVELLREKGFRLTPVR